MGYHLEIKKLNDSGFNSLRPAVDQGESTFYLYQEYLKFSEILVIGQYDHELLEDQPGRVFQDSTGLCKKDMNRFRIDIIA